MKGYIYPYNNRFNNNEIEKINETIDYAIEECIDEFGYTPDDEETYDHWQQLYIDYLLEKYNIEIKYNDNDYSLMLDLINNKLDNLNK